MASLPMQDVSVTLLGINFFPETTGNAPYTTALSFRLAEAGARVAVLTAFPHYPQWHRYDGFGGWRTESGQGGVTVFRLKHWIPYPPRGARRLGSELTFGTRLVFARWQRPSAVVLVSPALFASWLAMLRLMVQRRPRRIVWVQDLYSQGMAETGEGSRLAVRFARAAEGWTLRRAHEVVAIHDTMAARIADSLRVDPERITVIPNWSHITPSRLGTREARARLSWPDVFTVLHAGNMGAKQGLDVVVEAARLAARKQVNVRFVLLGDGGERQRLQESAAGLDNVDFLPPLVEDLFPVALAAADALLVTEAKGVAEMAAPSKLTSYFAARRPVIASVSDSGIVAQILAEAQAGTVVASGSAPELLTAVERLAKEPREAARAAAAAEDYWHRHLGPEGGLASWERVVRTTTLDGAPRGD